MRNLKTLSFYILKLYCRYFFTTLLVFAAVLILSGSFDVLQKFKSINIPQHIFWKLILYKIPYLLNEIIALISFVATLFLLDVLRKNNELIIILGSGVSIIRILLIAIITVLLLSSLVVGVINPVGVYGLQKYQQLEDKITKKRRSSIMIEQPRGILLFEEYKDEHRIIQVKSIDFAKQELKNIIILFLNANNRFLKRIDAGKAFLSDHVLKLKTVKITDANNTKAQDELDLETNLSIQKFADSFVEPEMISIWNLPGVIKQFMQSGLPVIKYQSYYYRQLFKPLMLTATVLLAGCFVNVNSRATGFEKKNLVLGILLGFVVYSASEIIIRVLVYNGLQPLWAVLIPILLIILISNFVILHLHEA